MCVFFTLFSVYAYSVYSTLDMKGHPDPSLWGHVTRSEPIAAASADEEACNVLKDKAN